MKKILCLITALILLCSCGESSRQEDKLWQGISTGNAELIKEAAQMGADIDTLKYRHPFIQGRPGVKGSTVFAALDSNLPHVSLNTARLLLALGADANIRLKKGQTLLHFCSGYPAQNRVMLRPLIEAGADFSGIYDDNGLNALDYAAGIEEGLYAFELYMDSGAAPTQKTVERAMENSGIDKLKMLRRILEYSADFDMDEALKCALLGDGSGALKHFEKSDRKEDVVLAAAAYCPAETAKQLCGDDTNMAALLKSAMMGGSRELVLWINGNYSYKYSDIEKRSTYAVMSGDLDFLKLLEDKKIYVNVDSAVKQLILQQDRECIDYLLSKGHYSEDLLLYAGMYGDFTTFAELLDNSPPEGGYMGPMVFFSAGGNAEALKLLIEYGGDVNGVYKSSAPLYAAVQYGNYDCAKLLLENGADVNIEVPNGMSVKALAEKIGAKRITELIYFYINSCWASVKHIG